VQLECICSQIIWTSSPFSWSKPEYREEKERLVPRLEALINRLIDENCASLAIPVTQMYIGMQSNPNTLLPVVDRIVSVTDLPREEKVNICLQAARKTQNTAIGDHFIRLGQESLKFCNHGTAHLDLEFIVLSRANQDLDDSIDRLWQLMEQLDKLKYRKHAIQSIQSMVSRCRDEPRRMGSQSMALAKWQKIAYSIGSRLYWTMVQQLYIPLMAHRNYGAAINLVETQNILNPRLMIPNPEIKFSLCLAMCANYMMRNNGAMGLRWAARALQFARMTGSRSKISQANGQYLTAIAELPIHRDEIPHYWSRLRSSWLLAIEKDRESCLVEEEFNLHTRFLGISASTTQMSTAEKDELVNRAQYLAELLAGKGDLLYLADIATQRGITKLGKIDFEGAINEYTIALKIFSKAGIGEMVAGMLYHIGFAQVGWWNHKRVIENIFDWTILATAKANLEAALSMFDDPTRFVLADATNYNLADIYTKQLEFVDASDTNVANNCLQYLSTVVSLRDLKRLEVAAVPGAQSIVDKKSSPKWFVGANEF
jgi:tetratricopeptide (TPR) repeat protein